MGGEISLQRVFSAQFVQSTHALIWVEWGLSARVKLVTADLPEIARSLLPSTPLKFNLMELLCQEESDSLIKTQLNVEAISSVNI